ncbi:MAG: hypothetical protein EHM24_03130 [Acidobacteria bacterium]|nr:MAG: hypothetical protein EHM24_03130 [Acidobacteriota bacterium]
MPRPRRPSATRSASTPRPRRSRPRTRPRPSRRPSRRPSPRRRSSAPPGAARCRGVLHASAGPQIPTGRDEVLEADATR